MPLSLSDISHSHSWRPHPRGPSSSATNLALDPSTVYVPLTYSPSLSEPSPSIENFPSGVNLTINGPSVSAHVPTRAAPGTVARDAASSSPHAAVTASKAVTATSAT